MTRKSTQLGHGIKKKGGIGGKGRKDATKMRFRTNKAIARIKRMKLYIQHGLACGTQPVAVVEAKLALAA